MTKYGPSVAPTNNQIQNVWICRGCGSTKHETWCWDCDINRNGKTLAEMREEKAVHDLDCALSATLDYDKVTTA